MEAIRVSNEGVIENLRLQVHDLEQKVQLLEEEKSALQTSQSSTNETQLAQIRALEMVSLVPMKKHSTISLFTRNWVRQSERSRSYGYSMPGRLKLHMLSLARGRAKWETNI